MTICDAKNGLCFERLTTGEVRVDLREPADGRPPEARAVKRDLATMTAREWVAAVAAVSHTGAIEESLAVALLLHEGYAPKSLEQDALRSARDAAPEVPAGPVVATLPVEVPRLGFAGDAVELTAETAELLLLELRRLAELSAESERGRESMMESYRPVAATALAHGAPEGIEALTAWLDSELSELARLRAAAVPQDAGTAAPAGDAPAAPPEG